MVPSDHRVSIDVMGEYSFIATYFEGLLTAIPMVAVSLWI